MIRTEYRATTQPNRNGKYEVRAVSVTDIGDVSRTVIAYRDTYSDAMELVRNLSR